MTRKNSSLRTVILLFLVGIQSVYANTVARFGGLFPVIEKDIREVILNKLSALENSGELKQLKKDVIERVEKQIERPKPSNLTTTTTPEVFYVDPSITINEDIYSADGEPIAKAGERINPFKRINFSKTLIFFNADDKRQINWVKAQYGQYSHVKFILTGGSIKEAQSLFGRVYFDLNQTLSRKLHIKHVPSVVVQDALVWKITEGAIL